MLTTVNKARVKQAGNTVIAFGPKFTTLTAPSLAALTTDVTCIVLSFNADENVTFTETQDLCSKDGTTELDKRTVALGPIRMRISEASWTVIKPLLAKDAEVGVAVRRFKSSDTALAVVAEQHILYLFARYAV